MKYFVEIGKARSAGGGLSKMTAAEALIVTKELHGRRLKNVHIYNAKTFAEVSLAELEQAAGTKLGAGIDAPKNRAAALTPPAP